MKTQARIATYRRMREQPLWRLLAADHAPEIIGLLQSLLLDGERRLPASILHERLQHALEQMERHGAARELVRSAQAYVAEWLSQGWLERRLPEGAHEEEYELSNAAIQALRFVAGLDDRRSAATETRLSLVIGQLVQLAEATETDPAARLAALYAERDQLDARIEQPWPARSSRWTPSARWNVRARSSGWPTIWPRIFAACTTTWSN